ncbi:MAG TPA: hypothetical protein DDW52_16800 [Planctomycetaceae bacterium]|nr:hypothetical protein [Planctomycetaceae bacterium]
MTSVSDRTFKSGVAKFWEWFPAVADRFHATIDAGKCADLADEVSEFMRDNLPGLAWVFGPGKEGGHSFTVSGDELLVRQLLAEEWIRHAKPIKGWTFYPARQAGKLDTISFSTDFGSVDAESLIVQTHVDEESQVVDVVAWHPAFEGMEDEGRYQILFLMLDEALGEFGTSSWIGDIKIRELPADAPHARAIAQLPKYIKSVEKYHRWEKLPPTQLYASYQLPEPYPGPRGDTIVGTTLIPNQIIDFIVGEGQMESNVLRETCADLAYIAFDAASLPDGNQSSARAELEDAIDEVLVRYDSGRVLGGAHGTQQAYIDILIFDGDRTVELLNQQIERLQMVGAQVHCIE